MGSGEDRCRPDAMRDLSPVSKGIGKKSARPHLRVIEGERDDHAFFANLAEELRLEEELAMDDRPILVPLEHVPRHVVDAARALGGEAPSAGARPLSDARPNPFKPNSSVSVRSAWCKQGHTRAP